MAEVRVITGGTEDVPQPNPPIPLDKFQAFAAEFQGGDISPYVVFGKGSANNGAFIVAPAPGDRTSLAIDMPAALDGASGVMSSSLFLRQSQDSFKERINIEAVSPEIMPIDGAATILVGLVNLFFNAGFAFIYSNATGMWSLYVSAINNQVITPLVPWTPGAKLEFTMEAKLKGAADTCIHVTAKQDGVLVADISFTFPERFDFPLVPTYFLQASSSSGSPQRLEIITSQSVVGYQNLADPVPTC